MRHLALMGFLIAMLPTMVLADVAFDRSLASLASYAHSRTDLLIAGASAQGAQAREQELADRYAPVVYLREVNGNICDDTNEGFDPVAVDFVLGREDIPLMASDNGEPSGAWTIVAQSPLPADLYGQEPPHFLNYPGVPVAPGCTYRQYFAQHRDEARNVAYAHIFQEPGTDQLVVQYWMYYYLNDWNNTHEGDWEMIMLFFDAVSVEEALAMNPSEIVYAQHGGGEKADWSSNKLTLEDGRPVIYVARGAHASQYEPKIYLGLAENGTGFGCENSKGPHRRLTLEAVVVPHEPSGPDDPFAWLGFTGRWGELKKSEWNGPTGPNTKTSWNEPVSWAEDVRDTSLIVPDYGGFGQAPVDIFCGAVGAGSKILVAFNSTPALIIGLFGVILITTSWIVSYALGSVRRAFGFYGANLRTFGFIGAALLPVGFVVAILQTIVFRIPPVEPFLSIMGRFPGIKILLALVLGSFNIAVALVFVAPAAIVATAQIRSGSTPGLVASYRQGFRVIWPILVIRLRVIVRAIFQALTIVGFPRAIQRLIGGLFIGQTVIIQNAEPESAMSESYYIAENKKVRIAITNTVLSVIVLLTGPLVAIFLLLAIPSRPLGLINFISSLLFALLYPIAVIGMTLLYYELRLEAGEWFEGETDVLESGPGEASA